MKRPLEVRQKISRSHMGIRPSEETRLKLRLSHLGKVSGMKGKKHTAEANRKNSEAHRGEKSNFWQGGKTTLDRLIRRSLKYRIWRTAVFTRDNYSCTWCGANKKYLNADHIKQFALLLHENNITTVEQAENCEELWQINNGRTLCVDCHKETDTFFNKGRHYAL